MARLAIRATGDKSTRENVTVGYDKISIAVWQGNIYRFAIRVEWNDRQGAIVRVSDFAGHHMTTHYKTCATHEKHNDDLRPLPLCECGEKAVYGDFCYKCAESIPR